MQIQRILLILLFVTDSERHRAHRGRRPSKGHQLPAECVSAEWRQNRNRTYYSNCGRKCFFSYMSDVRVYLCVHSCAKGHQLPAECLSSEWRQNRNRTHHSDCGRKCYIVYAKLGVVVSDACVRACMRLYFVCILVRKAVNCPHKPFDTLCSCLCNVMRVCECVRVFFDVRVRVHVCLGLCTQV